MSERPSTLCRLKTGAPLAPQENFAATFNWLVSFCENLRGAEGVVVDTTVSDHPVVKAEKSDDADGGGAGGSGGTLTVVTGLSFAFDGDGRLVATLSTKDVTLPAGGGVDTRVLSLCPSIARRQSVHFDPKLRRRNILRDLRSVNVGFGRRRQRVRLLLREEGESAPDAERLQAQGALGPVCARRHRHPTVVTNGVCHIACAETNGLALKWMPLGVRVYDGRGVSWRRIAPPAGAAGPAKPAQTLEEVSE